jgi:hypothetical protein
MIYRNEGTVVGQSDDCYYEESGWIAVVKDNEAALGHYSHCSCYGTWSSLCGGGVNDSGNEGPNWSWIGTPSELLEMAIAKEDPGLKGRTASIEDYDYDHLMDVYDQIKKHYNYSE